MSVIKLNLFSIVLLLVSACDFIKIGDPDDAVKATEKSENEPRYEELLGTWCSVKSEAFSISDGTISVLETGASIGLLVIVDADGWETKMPLVRNGDRFEFATDSASWIELVDGRELAFGKGDSVVDRFYGNDRMDKTSECTDSLELSAESAP